MRCNWLVYAQEFAAVAGFATGTSVPVEEWSGHAPETPHERKYMSSGHDLYRVVLRAADRGTDQAGPAPRFRSRVCV